MNNIPNGFEGNLESNQRDAKQYIKNPNRLNNLLNEAVQKANINKESMRQVAQYLAALIKMLSAWAKGRYRGIPLKAIVTAAAGILYFVNPFDMVSDLIPVMGYLDDVTIISFVAAILKDEIDAFQRWESKANSLEMLTE